jgi:hypothetical protein
VPIKALALSYISRAPFLLLSFLLVIAVIAVIAAVVIIAAVAAVATVAAVAVVFLLMIRTMPGRFLIWKMPLA